MPYRYLGGRLPPFFHANLFDYFIGAVCTAYGLAALVDGSLVPASIDLLPDTYTNAYRVVTLGAGILIFAGLTRGRHRWSFGLEILGMILAATIFGTYAVGLITASGNTNLGRSFLAATIFSLCTLACLLRASGLNLESRNRLRRLQNVPRDYTGEQ